MVRVAVHHHISYLLAKVRRHQVHLYQNYRQVCVEVHRKCLIRAFAHVNCTEFTMFRFLRTKLGLSPPTQAPWDQKPPHWVDHKPPQMQTHQVPPQSHPPPQMGGYMPQYWYPETNPSLLT